MCADRGNLVSQFCKHDVNYTALISDAPWGVGALQDLQSVMESGNNRSAVCLMLPLLLLPQAIESDSMLDNAKQRGVQLMKGLVKLADK